MTKNYNSLVVIALLLNMNRLHATDELPLQVKTKHDNDKVAIIVQEATVVVSIHSPFGISQAVIQPRNGKWPRTVKLRLHLKGLEHFKVTNDKVVIEASVSSHNKTIRLWKDAQEEKPLNAKNAYWTKIRIVKPDGKSPASIPVKDSYFEVQLPQAMFKDNPKSVTVSWIDFYR